MEQTGTSLRQLSTKMVTMEKTATNLFNAEMKLKNIYIETDKVTGKLSVSTEKTAGAFAMTADMLSSLAKEDAPKAIELLSSLYTKGQLSIETMNKIFTIQHAPYLTQTLTQINGDLDAYNTRLTTGSTVQEAYAQSMDSWANQLDRLKQAFSATNPVMSDFANFLGGTALKSLADFGESIQNIYVANSGFISFLKSTIVTLAELGAVMLVFGKGLFAQTAFKTLSSNIRAVGTEMIAISKVPFGKNMIAAATATGGLNFQIKALGVSLKALMFNPAFIAITAGLIIMEGINLATDSMRKQEEESLKLADAHNLLANNMKESQSSAKTFRESLAKTQIEINKLRSKSIVDDWNSLDSVMDSIIKKFDKLKDAQQAMVDLSAILLSRTDLMSGVKEADANIYGNLKTNLQDSDLKYKKEFRTGKNNEFITDRTVVPLNMSDADLQDLRQWSKLANDNLSKLYDNYVKTGKGLEQVKSQLKELGFIYDEKSFSEKAQKDMAEYQKTLADASSNTLKLESNIRDLINTYKDSMKTYKFNQAFDFISEADIKNVDSFKKALDDANLGIYNKEIDEMSKKGDIFKGIDTESGKLDLIKNKLMPLVSELMALDELEQATRANLDKIRGQEGQAENEKGLKVMLNAITKFREQAKINATIQKTTLSMREELNTSYNSELLNLERVGKGKLEILELDKKLYESQAKSQADKDNNNVDYRRSIIDSEMIKYGERGKAGTYSDKELRGQLDALNSNKNLNADEEKRKKMLLDYFNALDEKQANQTKYEIQKLQNTQAGIDLQIEMNRLNVEYLNIGKNNAEIEHDATVRAKEDVIKLSKEKDKAFETEVAYQKYLNQQEKEEKARISDNSSIRSNYAEGLNVRDRGSILSGTDNKINLQYDIDRRNIQSDIADLQDKANSRLTTSIEKDTIRNQLAQKYLDLKKLTAQRALDEYDAEKSKRERENTVEDEALNLLNIKRNISNLGKDETYITKSNLKSNGDSLLLSRDRLKTEQDALDEAKFFANNREDVVALAEIENRQKALNLDLAKQLTAEEQHKLDILNEQYNRNLKNVSLISSTINSMTSGQTAMPSYNLTNVESKIAGSLAKKKGAFGGANLNGQDYAEIGNFILTQTSNVFKTINDRQITTLNHELSMLDIKKQLATTDEERQKIDREILDKKIEVINLEAQSAQQQSIVGGVTQGVSTFASNPTVVGAIMGGIQILGGIFSGNNAKKQADRQKEQLKEQQKANEILERQAKLMEQQQKFYETWLKYSFSGVDYGMNRAFSDINRSTKGATYEGSTGYALKVGKKQTTYEGENFESYEELQNYLKTTPSSISAWKDTLNEALQTETGKKVAEEMKSNGETIFEAVRNVRNFTDYFDKEGLGVLDSIQALDEQIKILEYTYEQALSIDEEFVGQKKTIHSTYFNWETKQYVSTDEAVKNNLAKVGEYYKFAWKQREDIMNQFVENAKTGSNNIASYMGDYTVNSIISAWTRNDAYLNDLLDKIEKNVTRVSDLMSEKLGTSFSSLSDFDIFDSEAQTSYNPLQNLVGNYQLLSDEQDVVNNQASIFVKIWTEAGGKISDVLSMMPQFSKDLYNAISGALEQNDFVERFNSIGETLSTSIVNKLKENLMNNRLSSVFTALNEQITAIMGGENVSINSVISLRQQIEKATAQMTTESEKIKNITDLLSMSNDVQYTSANSEITYSSGSTSTNNNNFNIVITQDIGNILTMEKSDKTKISQELATEMTIAIESKIGKILTK